MLHLRGLLPNKIEQEIQSQFGAIPFVSDLTRVYFGALTSKLHSDEPNSVARLEHHTLT